jgi:hypothetical protein
MAQITLNSTGVASNGSLVLQSNGTTAAVTVDTAQNVGLGVTPSAWANYSAFQIGAQSSLVGNASFAILSQNWRFDGSDKYIATAAASQYYQGSGAHVWRTAASGTAGNAITFTQAMTLDASGNLLINRTSTFSTAGGDTPKLYSAGALAVISGSNVSSFSNDRINFNASTFFVLGSSTGGGVKLDNGTTAWAAQSDESTKDIIEPISNAINKVDNLRAVIGKYKEDVEGTRRSFLIAQDVQAVLPEAVSTSSDGLLSLRYTEVIPLLVAAIKEQNQLITILTDRITALEAK